VSSFTRATFTDTKRKNRAGRKVYVADQDFYFEVGYLGSGIRIPVSKGCETDGASVPRWLMWAVKPESMIKAATVHDLMRRDTRFSLIECDAMFLVAMEAERVAPWLREAAFLAVRANISRF
jgi:hypothetical protein